MENNVRIPQGRLTAKWQAPQEMAVPDKQARARQFNTWLRKYEGISIGEYPDTGLGIITVTVAGATFVYHTWEFPTVDLYVKIALAINTGNLKKRDLRTRYAETGIFKSMVWIDDTAHI